MGFLAALHRGILLKDTATQVLSTVLWSCRFLSRGAFTLLASATFLNQFGLGSGIAASLGGLFLTLGAARVCL